MVVNKRSKHPKMLGRRGSGKGSQKKARGAGSHGGRGMAGSGKRAGHKKTEILKLYGQSYYGRSGFKRPQELIKDDKTINLDYLDSHLDNYLEKKLITKDGDLYIVDIKKLGFEKILARGNIKHKLRLKAPKISKNAEEKIIKAGGVIIGVDSK
jgi:large subunit ribosomal protein L15